MDTARDMAIASIRRNLEYLKMWSKDCFSSIVFESALEIIGPSLALGDVVSTLEFAFDAVCACGSGAGALCFAVLTARAGASHLEG